MYMLFSWKVWVALAVWLTIMVVTAASLFVPFPGLEGLPFAARTIAFVVELLVASLLCDPVWRWLWRNIPILGSSIYPDLNGTWHVSIDTNWPIQERLMKAARHECDAFNVMTEDAGALPLTKMELQARVHQSWTSMGMELKAIKGDSVEIVVIPQRAEGGHKHSLAYLFRQVNPKPDATDEREFQGAAWLEIERDGRVMKGRYWTNRSWHRGLNTAGLVTFIRAAGD